MKQFFKVLMRIILIICGGLCLLAALAFLILATLFKAEPSDIQ